MKIKQNLAPQKKPKIRKKIAVAIIGAGWAGIGCTRVLSQSFSPIDVYEANDDIGGVWHPINHYEGLTIHQSAIGIEFHDFPLPKHINKLERVSANEVYKYLQSFCKAKKLYKYIQCNKKIKKIRYDSHKRKIVLTIEDKKNGEIYTSQPYDYVINTDGLSKRPLPKFKLSNKFKGKIIHSFAANKEMIKNLISENKKIVVLGASKTATDIILNLQKYDYDNFDWLYRESYWFLNFDYISKIFQISSLRYYFNTFPLIAGLVIGGKFPSVAYWLWRSCGIIHTYGTKHTNFKKFHLGLIDEKQMDILHEINKKHSIQAEILNFTENGILLSNNKEIKADYVICCTGSEITLDEMIDTEVDGKLFKFNQIKKIYRCRVIPEIPNLIFTTYHPFSLGMINGINQGNWINYYINKNLTTQDLEKSSIIHPDPFFLYNPHFDSRNHVLLKMFERIGEFFHNKELSKFTFIKWYYNFFHPKSIPPLPFNWMKKNKKVS